MSIEETYKGMWSSDPSLLKSLLDAGETIIAVSGMGYGRAFFYDCDYVFQVGDDLYYIEKRMGELLFLLPPRPLVLEPKPLEWSQDVDNEKCESAKCGGEWRFYVSSKGCGHIYFRHETIFYTNSPSMDAAKEAIHEWRVNHLNSMLP